MEAVASAVADCLREHFVDKDSKASLLPVVRCYATRRREAAAAGPPPGSETAAAGPRGVQLRLLTSAEEDPSWSGRRTAPDVISLSSARELRRSPMIAELVGQLGLDPQQLVDPEPTMLRELEERTYEVFFVPQAVGSHHVPEQDEVVIPYGVRSVLGVGTVLPDGTLFVVVLFSRASIPFAVVKAFAAVALSIKLALLPHVADEVFGQSGVPRPSIDRATLDELVVSSEIVTLSRLLELQSDISEREVAVAEELALRVAGSVARDVATSHAREAASSEARDVATSEARAVASSVARDIAISEERAREFDTSRAALALSEAHKAAILEGALDCVIGMDSQGRITDFNKAAEVTFGCERSDAIGQDLADFLIPAEMRERHRSGLARLLATGDGPILGRRIEVDALRRDGSEFPVELSVTRVEDTDPPFFNAYLRDITAPRVVAAELAANRERLAHIAKTLQTSLLPPLLPEIDGIELAAAFRAFGDGYEVGGDFYDVFELGGGHWALTLGDVCGKGSEAAVVTALARYTLRAAAMRRRNPADVLATLNEAIRRQHPGKLCTAVYATLDPSTGMVQVALGGHPHPLLLTAAGAVTAVGITSPLLGAFASWKGATDTVVLAAGDMLLLYSDGVTEARAGEEFFGEDHLEAALGATAGRHATAAVELIERAVLDFAGELSDDLAVLAVRRSVAEPPPESGPAGA